MSDQIDPYKILQVDSEAEDEVITAAYRRLARKYHPDLAASSDAADRMTRINAAWELIGDPAKRAAYDRSKLGGSAGRTTGTGTGSGQAPATAKGAGHPPPSPPAAKPTPPPEVVSPDWTSGRSSQGGGFDESMRAAEGLGAAGPPPGRPSGSVLNFGRYAGWSLGEIARHDLEYIEWLDRAPIGRNFRDEVDKLLRSSGRRRSAADEADDRRGLYRRR
jgi:curved DNA-binding protein CbpA